MLKKVLLSVVLGTALLAVAACSTSKPIASYSGAIPASLTHEQVAEVIINAGNGRDWVMKRIDDNTISATYMARSHRVVCNVVFDSVSYKIEYVSSVNMEAKDGSIHRNYNRWANNLRHDIEIALLQADARR